MTYEKGRQPNEYKTCIEVSKLTEHSCTLKSMVKFSFHTSSSGLKWLSQTYTLYSICANEINILYGRLFWQV